MQIFTYKYRQWPIVGDFTGIMKQSSGKIFLTDWSRGNVIVDKEKQKIECDVLILGGGPAGLSAAIYCGRAKLKTVVLEEGVPGGQAATTYHIANYPGTSGVINGAELTNNMRKQAEYFQADIQSGVKVQEVNLISDKKVVKTENADYTSRAVIIATGAQPRKLQVEGADTFKSRGVHYCATCDGPFYQGKRVIVVGGGNSALQEAVFLTRFAEQVAIVHQFDHFQGSKVAQEEVFNNPKIKIRWSSTIRKIHGDDKVSQVTVYNSVTGQEETVETDAVFVYIGTEPKSELFKGQVDMDETGYIITDGEMRTKLPGVFAAGDIRKKEVRQAITAAGDGATAAVNAEKYLTN